MSLWKLLQFIFSSICAGLNELINLAQGNSLIVLNFGKLTYSRKSGTLCAGIGGTLWSGISNLGELTTETPR